MSNIVYLCVVFISILVISLFIIQWRIESFIIHEDNSVIQTIRFVQDSFEGLKASAKKAKQTTIDSKSVKSVLSKNIDQLDILVDTYETMDRYTLDPVSSMNKIQENLNAFIDIYNYVNDKLKLEQPALERNMIKVSTAQYSEQKMNQQLGLPSNELNKQLEVQLANQKPMVIHSQKPVVSALKPPPNLINIIKPSKKPSTKPSTKEVKSMPEPDIIDIYDMLNDFIKNN